MQKAKSTMQKGKNQAKSVILYLIQNQMSKAEVLS